MNSQHHFIVMYDAESKEWVWDTDTEEAVFTNGGAIFLPDKGEWTNSSDTEELNDIDTEVSTNLSKAIALLNEQKGN